MNAVQAKLIDFLKKSPQFVIPIYQRTYSWGSKECRQLWDDILRTGCNEQIAAHFVGSIVYVEEGLYSVSSQAPLLVIDGQQRLTTVMLLMEALARHVENSEPFEGFSANKIRNYYLLNPLEAGKRKYKLILSQTDSASLMAILDQRQIPKEHSIRVVENFKYFIELIEEMKDDLQALCKGLAKLVIVDISLNRDQDNPQLIFESLNSTGRELSQADLIRNFILMGLEPNLQTSLYEQFWHPMELDFGQKGYAIQFNSFMRYYLTVKTGIIPNEREVYDAFKEYTQSPELADRPEGLVEDMHKFAGYYCAMALDAETDPELKAAFRDLRELKVNVAYPFLLELYNDYAKKAILKKHELLQVIRLIESYVFRRAVCDIPTNSLNKTFATFGRTLKKDCYVESVMANFLLLPSYRRFPSNDEFKSKLQIRNLYNFRSRSYWLRRLENLDRKERVIMDEFTIEHILPQNENLSGTWKAELGPEWERVHKSYLHTLGNLTLTGYNSEYSDRSFAEKRDMKGGFKESPLKLNQGLGQLEHWTEKTICQRADNLSEQMIRVWPMPDIEKVVLETYKQKAAIFTKYNIEDHPHLASGAMRKVFEIFRKEVIALDPCVTEEFLKLYVAYKAETNFVDLVPLAKRLRLSLNIGLHELNDPKGICKDVTNLGRWGNGNVEVDISLIEELPYVMEFVRQAFEKQIVSDLG